MPKQSCLNTPMTTFAVQYTYSADVATITEVRPRHREFLREQLDAGNLLASGPLTDGAPGALLLFRVADSDALTEILAADPFAVVGGVITKTTVRVWDPVIGPWAE